MDPFAGKQEAFTSSEVPPRKPSGHLRGQPAGESPAAHQLHALCCTDGTPAACRHADSTSQHVLCTWRALTVIAQMVKQHEHA